MDKTVTIYSTPTCHFCQLAKEFFKENGVPYTELDAASDPVARQAVIDITGKLAVPVIVVGDDAIVGFDKDKLTELLGLTPTAVAM